MDNTTLQEFITQFGNRIYCINMDNTRFIYVGYNGGPALENISLETVGGTDFIVISLTDDSSGKAVTYKNYHVTDNVQWIGIMDEEFVDAGVDPLKLR